MSCPFLPNVLTLGNDHHDQCFVALPSPARNTRVFPVLSRRRCRLSVDPSRSGWGWVFVSLRELFSACLNIW